MKQIYIPSFSLFSEYKKMRERVGGNIVKISISVYMKQVKCELFNYTDA